MVEGATVKTDRIKLSTKGHTDIIDISKQVDRVVLGSGIEDGIITLFVIGSTGALTTVEFEPGLVADLNTAFEKIAPRAGHYQHHERWHDDNGHSHVRASLLGPSLVIPIVDGRLTLGTWQQIVFIDFDTSPRKREIVCQIIGR